MNLLKHRIVFALLVCITLSACEDFIGGDINSDPNNPTEVPVSALTPAIQINIADVIGGEFSRLNGALIQQVEGVARQWTPFYAYTGLTPNRFDRVWENVYENILNEIKVATNIAAAEGNNHYVAILNIMEAYILMMATDMWDDMPYSEALLGIENINPAYDTQASIYQAVHHLLDNGISLLNGTPGSLTPGNEDLFYSGDTQAWIKVAHAIKARAFLHYADYEKARTEAENSFASTADNMGFQYPDANAAAPWYRFNRDRTGDIEFNPTMKSIMNNLNDTIRLAVFDQIFTTSNTYLVADFFQEMITYREMQFVIAETDFRATPGGTQPGHDAYLAGIRASFDRLGLTEADYESYIAQPEIDPGVGNLTLEMIMTQKYIALFLDPELYTDWRRTNIPALTPVSGLSIPVRWHYSATEYLFNENAPAEGEVDIFNDRVGWNR